MQQQWEIELEKLVDTHGLRAVLASLADMCEGKAEHIRANDWRDRKLAWPWVRASRKLSTVLPKLDV
jgi:hypothetical protein